MRRAGLLRTADPHESGRGTTICPVERFDAVVVGAGPAGSTAAYHLARGGASVLLLDRARFPRDKPCGGGLTRRAVRLLPFSVDPVVEDAASHLEVRHGYRRKFERRSSEPVVLLTKRARLDAYLVEQAARAGADFRDGVRVADLVAGESGVSATVDGRGVAAAALIAADGANGLGARSLGLGGGIVHGVGLEGNVPYPVARRTRFCGRLVLELGTVPGGYGWVFPKGDHVNVGVGGWEREAPRLREHLRRLCDAHALPFDRVESLRGHRLPMRSAATRFASRRAVVVGDAAGLVDPLSGDGIYEAFLSSSMAAETVLDVLAGRSAGLEPYGERVTVSLARLHASSWRLKLTLDRFPRLAFELVRLPLVWPVIEGVVRGDLSHPGAARGVVRGPLRALALLARGAGGIPLQPG